MVDDIDDGDMPPHVRKVMEDIEARGDKPAYAVGYGKPPKASQFVKGRPSANPKGRPRKNKAFQQLLSDQLNRKVTITVNGRRKRVTLNEVVIQQLAKMAAEGDLPAIRDVIKLNQLIAPLKPHPTEINEAELAQRRELSAKLVDLLEAANHKPERPRRPPPPTEPEAS